LNVRIVVPDLSQHLMILLMSLSPVK
jgi:hypothetical protein